MNIDPECFEIWPATLDNSFTMFDNMVVDAEFNSIESVLNWLENNIDRNMTSRMTNKQNFKNGDPNKVYSIYKKTVNNEKYIFVFSLRYKKQNEISMNYIFNGAKRKTSFIKSETHIDYVLLQSSNDIEYSSDILIISGELVEGIYPEIDSNSNSNFDYNNYVQEMYDKYENINPNVNKIFTLTYAKSLSANKFLDEFLKKLNIVELFLKYFSKGGGKYVNILPDKYHFDLLDQIKTILEENKNIDMDTKMNVDIQQQVSNFIFDPLLYHDEMYQIRVGKTILTWHSDYSDIIKETRLIPSKQFVNVIINFGFADFFKQFHSNSVVEKMLKNIKTYYGYPIDRNSSNLIETNKMSNNVVKINKSFNKKK
jgi:hypothetical protein